MPEFVPHHSEGIGDDDFARGYFQAMEFTECHNDNPELRDAEGFSPELIAKAHEDCQNFCEANAVFLARIDMERAGNDFWYSRNGHGTGFYDRGLGLVGKRLHAEARRCGEVNIYVGDDGLIYGG